MRTKYDVVVVGGRVAGTSLAIHLRRLGLSVAIFDRADLPGDTMSTHVIYPNTIARLEHLGVLDRIMAHRPPPLYTSWYHQNRMFVASLRLLMARTFQSRRLSWQAPMASVRRSQRW